jgi:hypothetical protein
MKPAIRALLKALTAHDLKEEAIMQARMKNPALIIPQAQKL